MKEWIIKIITIIVTVLAPIHAVMISVGVLVIADLITGIWAAIKRGEKVRSAAMRRTISKMLIYQIALITGFIFERYILEDLIPMTKIVASVIGMVEIKSIFENLNTIYGSDLFKVILSKLGSENDRVAELQKLAAQSGENLVTPVKSEEKVKEKTNEALQVTAQKSDEKV